MTNLQMVVEKQWFPMSSRVTIPDGDATLVREFHQWLTRRQMATEPTIDPPNCITVLMNWRILSTVLNCIGKEKPILRTPDVQAVENTAGTTKQSDAIKESHQDAQPIEDTQPGKDAQLLETVQEPAQVTQTVKYAVQPVQVS